MSITGGQEQSRWQRLPLSYAQETMLFLHRLTPHLPLYNVPKAFQIEGDLQVEALEKAFDLIRARHDVLRTNFALVEGEPLQLQRAPEKHRLPVIDISSTRAGYSDSAIRRSANCEARYVFDLRNDSMLHAALLRITQSRHVLVVTIHHIACDGCSFGIVMDEVGQAYRAYARQEEPRLRGVPLQYVAFAVSERKRVQSAAFEETISFWKKNMAGCVTTCELIPPDHSRPLYQTFRGATVKSVLPAELHKALVELGQLSGASISMVMLAALQVVLYARCGKTDAVIGIPVANRSRPEFFDVVGCLLNEVPIRCNLSGNPSFIQILHEVREAVLNALAHQEWPFSELVRLLRPKRSSSQSPLFQVEFLFQNYAMPNMDWPGLSMKTLDVDTGTAKFDLSVIVERRETFDVKCEYNTDLFEAETIHSLLRHYETILKGVLKNPHSRLLDLATGFACSAADDAAPVRPQPVA